MNMRSTAWNLQAHFCWLTWGRRTKCRRQGSSQRPRMPHGCVGWASAGWASTGWDWPSFDFVEVAVLCFTQLLFSQGGNSSPPTSLFETPLPTLEMHLHWDQFSCFPLMLGKTEGKRRRGWQRMRWLDSIVDLMDMNLSKLWDSEGQGSLACCSSWSHKELNTI